MTNETVSRRIVYQGSKRVDTGFNTDGTERDKETCSLDEHGHELACDRVGSSNVDEFQYLHDNRGNWTEKRHYERPRDGGKRKLVQVEKRTITYYE